MAPIPLLNSEFDRSFQEAVKFEKEFFSNKKNLGLRGPNFFPNKADELNLWLYSAKHCCGVLELTAIHLPHIWSTGWKVAHAETGIDLQTIRRLVTTWVIGMYEEIQMKEYGGWGDDDDLGLTGPGIILYPYPVDSEYADFAEILKQWGFVNLLSFPNPVHGGHQLDLLACSTYVASNAIKRGDINWLDGSGTSRAQSAAHVTM